ncbi:MAG: zf-TFIIB domain-containing protein [Burkholderiaceae bacterium]
MPSFTASVCTSCQQPLLSMVLEGHYTAKVQVDVCPRCHLVWFDPLESVRLSGLGWVQLIRQMIASPAVNAPLAQRLACVRCQSPLKAVRNLTRFGRSAAQECPSGHGHYQGYSLLLAERGLVRPIYPHDRQALLAQGRSLGCLNCGAQLDSTAQECSYCDSPVVLVDMPRLTQALLMRFGDALELNAPAQQLGVACIGCGQALDPTQDIRCDHCDQSVVLPQLHLLTPLLDHIEPILHGRLPRQARPWGQRLRRLQGDVRATHLYRLLRHLRGPSLLPGEYDPVNLLAWTLLLAFLLWLLWQR